MQNVFLYPDKERKETECFNKKWIYKRRQKKRNILVPTERSSDLIGAAECDSSPAASHVAGVTSGTVPNRRSVDQTITLMGVVEVFRVWTIWMSPVFIMTKNKEVKEENKNSENKSM